MASYFTQDILAQVPFVLVRILSARPSGRRGSKLVHSSMSSGHMKVAAKRPAAAVGVSLAVVGALQGTPVVGDDATAVVAVEKKQKQGKMPTKACHHNKNPVRRHGKAIPELCPMASK